MILGTMPYYQDYSLCQQTVTVYHYEDGTLTRTVLTGAYLDFKKTENVEKTGSTEANGFLFVYPCSTSPVAVGDKVMHGAGPEPAEGEDVAKWWRTFIPAKYVGLGVIKYVDPKYWAGQMVHVEAGGG